MTSTLVKSGAQKGATSASTMTTTKQKVAAPVTSAPTSSMTTQTSAPKSSVTSPSYGSSAGSTLGGLTSTQQTSTTPQTSAWQQYADAEKKYGTTSTPQTTLQQMGPAPQKSTWQQYANAEKRYAQTNTPQTSTPTSVLTQGEDWRTNANVADPWGIRESTLQRYGTSDTGTAARYAYANGDYTGLAEQVANRNRLRGNDPDEEQILLNNMLSQTNTQRQQWEGLRRNQDEIDRTLAEQRAAEEDRIRYGVERAVNELEHQKGDVNRAAEQSGEAAWVAYMNAQNRYGRDAEQAARYGSGGASNFMDVMANANFQNAQAQITGNRDRLISEISLAIEQAKLSGDFELASAIAEHGARQIANLQWSYGQEAQLFETQANATQRYADAAQSSLINNRNFERDVLESDRDYGWMESQASINRQDALNSERRGYVLDLQDLLIHQNPAINPSEALRLAQEYVARVW